jgi:LysM repeat protein
MSGNRIGFNFQPTNKFDAAQKPASKEPSILQKEVPKQDDYIVKRGDTLTEIAVKTGQNLQELLKKNPQIKNPNKIQIGQRIEIGKPLNTYTVKAGDTLSEIAKAKQTSVGDIMRANRGQIGNRNLIYPGQKLHLPVHEAKTPTTKPKTTTPTKTPTGKVRQLIIRKLRLKQTRPTLQNRVKPRRAVI